MELRADQYFTLVVAASDREELLGAVECCRPSVDSDGSFNIIHLVALAHVKGRLN